MAVVIPPGFAQVAYRFLVLGDPDEMLTTCGVSMTGLGDGVAAASTLSNEWLAAWGAIGRSPSYTFKGVYLAVGQDGGPPARFSAEASSIGTGVQLPPPNNCAILIRKRTNLGGRRNRGRLYLPPYPLGEDNVDASGAINEAQRASLAITVNNWLGTPARGVILHDAVLAPGVTPVPTPITQYVVQGRLATQRRRMRP